MGNDIKSATQGKSLTETIDTISVKQKQGLKARFSGLIYLVRRLITYIIVGIISVLLNFILPRFMPGDPATLMIQDIVRQTGQYPGEYIVRQIYDRYGDPNENVLVSFVKYLNRTIHGDFGISISQFPIPTLEVLKPSIPWTVYLSIVSIMIGWVIGTFLGARLGWRPGGRLDTIVTPISMFVSSIPGYWLAMILVWNLCYSNAIFPATGAYDDAKYHIGFTFGFLMSVLFYSILPLFSLVFVGFMHWMFSMRNMMITTINEDYVQLARAKGLSPSDIKNKYATRNALLPNFTGLAQSFGGSLTAVVLAESIFVYPGIGSVLGAAQGARDYPLMQTCVLIFVGVALLFNFLADSVYVLLDPRIKER